MTRPVEGYLSEDGQFFETKQQCEIYETALALHDAMRASYLVRHYEIEGPTLDFIIKEIIEFLNNNADIVQRYLDAHVSDPLTDRTGWTADQSAADAATLDPDPEDNIDAADGTDAVDPVDRASRHVEAEQAPVPTDDIPF